MKPHPPGIVGTGLLARRASGRGAIEQRVAGRDDGRARLYEIVLAEDDEAARVDGRVHGQDGYAQDDEEHEHENHDGDPAASRELRLNRSCGIVAAARLPFVRLVEIERRLASTFASKANLNT